jgi:hypothetical protein
MFSNREEQRKKKTTSLFWLTVSSTLVFTEIILERLNDLEIYKIELALCPILFSPQRGY